MTALTEKGEAPLGSNRTTACQQIALVGPFEHDTGNSYKAHLTRGHWARELSELGDSNETPLRSQAALFEDDAPIGQPHMSHAAIAREGKGRYSHWGETIYFSASDNSDPNTNGRCYSISIGRNFEWEKQFGKKVEAAIVSFLNRRLAELGPGESGLYDYYTRAAQTGAAFQIYDGAVARFVVECASGFDRYVEIGAGIGQLTALLASEGLRAVAVEGDRQRARAAAAMREALSAEIEGISDNMSVVEAFFPSHKAMIDRRTLVLFTNIIHSNNDGNAILAGCRDAGAIIIDICRFGHSRTTADLWRALIRQIRDLGFPYADSVLSWGDPTQENQKSPSCGRVLYFHRGTRLMPARRVGL